MSTFEEQLQIAREMNGLLVRAFKEYQKGYPSIRKSSYTLTIDEKYEMLESSFVKIFKKVKDTTTIFQDYPLYSVLILLPSTEFNVVRDWNWAIRQAKYALNIETPPW